MSLLKKLTLPFALGLALVSMDNSLGTPSQNHLNPNAKILILKKNNINKEDTGFNKQLKKSQKAYSDYELKKKVMDRITISYDEWRKAVENINSDEAHRLALKAEIISYIGEQLIEDLLPDERRDYKEFWKNFRIDTNDIIPENCSEEMAELALSYSIPAILEMQTDISKTYKRSFNFSILSEGERYLIYTHVIYDLKYKSLGNKRKTHLEKIIEKINN